MFRRQFTCIQQVDVFASAVSFSPLKVKKRLNHKTERFKEEHLSMITCKSKEYIGSFFISGSSSSSSSKSSASNPRQQYFYLVLLTTGQLSSKVRYVARKPFEMQYPDLQLIANVWRKVFAQNKVRFLRSVVQIGYYLSLSSVII